MPDDPQAKPTDDDAIVRWLTENCTAWVVPTHKLGISITCDTPRELLVYLIGDCCDAR